MSNTTLDYYNKNADSFVEGTVSVDFSNTQVKFIEYLQGKKILDFGCGSGRDTKYFLDAGFDVEAIDGSIELCKSASEYTGINVKHMLFQELDAKEAYDGIWACASILHLPKSEIKAVIAKMVAALVDSGIIYMSFKYGNFEGERNGRYFTDMTEDSVTELFTGITGAELIEMWNTSDVRPGRGEEKWINIILRKTTI